MRLVIYQHPGINIFFSLLSTQEHKFRPRGPTEKFQHTVGAKKKKKMRFNTLKRIRGSVSSPGSVLPHGGTAYCHETPSWAIISPMGKCESILESSFPSYTIFYQRDLEAPS